MRLILAKMMKYFKSFNGIRNFTSLNSINKKFNPRPWHSFGIFALSGLGLLGYFQYQKQQLAIQREESKSQSYGKPNVGGPFSLVDHNGTPVTDLDYRGKYMLMYFGYTFCPDVCPEELERMAEIIDNLDEITKNSKNPSKDAIVPIFISCDPKRDSVESIGEYLKDFHPDFIGLTGTYNQIKKIAKSYRLYFSAPPLAVDDDSTDYLVDHSIFFYLMDPDGKYLAHFGRTDTVEDVTNQIQQLLIRG